MRNFDEHRAEIFRRSDARIRTRKLRRQQALLLCLPLIVTVGVIALLPRQPLVTEDTDTIVAVEIVDHQGTFQNYNAELTSTLSFTLENAFTVTFEEDMVLDSAPESTPTQEQTSTSKKKPHTVATMATAAEGNISMVLNYQILLTDSAGNTVTYRLTGNVLKNLNTDKEVTLTADAAARLRELLEQMK